jgi:SSS family solute:Na+ symporter/sodium/pantothenate symporter
VVTRFSDALQVIITVGILCAGISTLEGILLALSTIISADLYLGIFENNMLKDRTPEQRSGSALKVGRLSIVFLAAVTFFLSLWQIRNPTGGSVTIFAQYGIYLLITVSFVPLASGMFLPTARRPVVMVAALSSGGAYLLAAGLNITYMANNPAFLASVGMITGWCVFAVGTGISRLRSR